MTTTPHFNFQKPAPDTFISPAQFNANADVMDEQLYLNQQHRADGTTHIGTTQKTTPVDADAIAIVDSADGKTKRILWSKVKALFATATHRHLWSEIDSKPSSYTPSAHKASHLPGGSDAMTVSDLGGYTKDETLKAATKTLLGLPSTAMPDDAFRSIVGRAKIEIASYIGTGTTSNTIQFGIAPDFVIIQRIEENSSEFTCFLSAVKGSKIGFAVQAFATNYSISPMCPRLVWGVNSLTMTNSLCGTSGFGVFNMAGMSYKYVAITL